MKEKVQQILHNIKAANGRPCSISFGIHAYERLKQEIRMTTGVSVVVVEKFYSLPVHRDAGVNPDQIVISAEFDVQ
jgi:hypothetical protein